MALSVKENEQKHILTSSGGIQLLKKDDEYIIIGGHRVYKYKSSTWAEKRFNRVTNITK